MAVKDTLLAVSGLLGGNSGGGGGGSTLITKTITENGTYAASSDNADGYSSVTVDVSGGWVSSISVSVNQDDRAFTTDDLDDIKRFLTVVASYTDGTTATLTDDQYEITGTLTAGTCTLSVVHGDGTQNFNITVTEAVEIPLNITTPQRTTTTTYFVPNAYDNEIAVVGTGTYRSCDYLYKSFAFDSGYNYRLTADVYPTTENIRLTFRNNADTLMATAMISTAGRFVVDEMLSDLSKFSTPGSVSLLVTMGTSETGKCIFKNLKCIKYLAQ